MRRLVLIGGIVAGLAVVAGAVVVANLNRIVDANRERILAEVSAGFGRPVGIERIAVALRGGIGMRLEGFRVADDPAFSKEDFIVADAVRVVVRLWPLLHGRIEVRRIVVEAPRITLVRTARGMNLDSLGQRQAPAVTAGTGGGGGGGGGGSVSPAIVVALVNIRDGVVRYVDRSGPTPVEHTITPLHLALSDLSQKTPVRVELEATVVGEVPTQLHVTGHVGPVGDPAFATDVPIQTHLTLHGPLVEIPALDVAGSIRRDAGGRPIATVHVRAPTLQVNGVTLSALEVDTSERDGVAKLDRLGVQVFGGAIAGQGHVDHRTAPPVLALETKASGLAVEELLAAGGSAEAARVHGRLEGTGSVTATLGDAGVVRRSLVAAGHVEVRDGTIREVNLADDVLTGVTGMGGLVTLVPPRLRNRYPEVFSTGDTRFEQFSADVQVAGGHIHMDPAVVSAHDYTVSGNGTATFAQHVDFTATFVASERLTKDIVGAIKEATYLVDDAGRLSIPFRLVGTMPNVRPKPDSEFLGRVLRKALVGEGLGHLLGDDDPGPAKKPGDKKKASDARKDLLRKGLKGLFGR